MSFTTLMMKMMSWGGKSIIRSLEKKSKDPLKYQEELLLSVLEDNKYTEYGRKYGFEDIQWKCSPT